MIKNELKPCCAKCHFSDVIVTRREGGRSTDGYIPDQLIICCKHQYVCKEYIECDHPPVKIG